MAETILEKLKKLRDDFEHRKRQIDELLTNYNQLAVNADTMVKEITKRMNELQSTIEHIDELIKSVTMRVNDIEKQFSALKNKTWFRLLFGELG